VVGLERLLRDAIQNVDPNVAVGPVRPMSEAVATALAARRFSILLMWLICGSGAFSRSGPDYTRSWLMEFNSETGKSACVSRLEQRGQRSYG